VIFSSRSIVGTGGVDFVIKVAEVVGLVIAGYRGCPFLVPFVPADAFVFRGFRPDVAEVAAVLGKGADAEVLLPVIQAVVVNVVNDQMVRGVEDFAVHFDAFAVFFASGVVIFRRTFRKPGILAQARVVFGIDNGELSAGQRYQAWGVVPGAGCS